MAERTRRIESGDQVVVGVNSYTEFEESPLGGEGKIELAVFEIAWLEFRNAFDARNGNVFKSCAGSESYQADDQKKSKQTIHRVDFWN